MSAQSPQPEGSRMAILRLLCTSGHRAAELARELGVSTSAVRKTLARLDAEGLVRYHSIARGVGKPAHQYEITAEGELRLSTAYLPLLHAVLQEIEETLPVSAMEGIIRAAGRRMAMPAAAGPLRQRVASAASTLNSFGASASVHESAAGLGIACTCCAIGAVVAQHPLACKGMEALLADHIGAPVAEQCERSGRPQCRFKVG